MSVVSCIVDSVPSSKVSSVNVSSTLKKQLKSLITAFLASVVDGSAFQIVLFLQVVPLLVLILNRYHENPDDINVVVHSSQVKGSPLLGANSVNVSACFYQARS